MTMMTDIATPWFNNDWAVKMKPEEMLTSEEKAKTDKQKQEFIESRQLDYWDEKADEVHKRLGLAVSELVDERM